MTVSVVMATHNGGAFLPEQLATLAFQTRPPDELIVSDDSSEDNTIQILYAFKASAPFPVAIHQNNERLGFATNFSNATQKAKGELILFCDQDDSWVPQKIEVVADWFEAHPGMRLVAHNISICDESLNTYISSYFEYLDRNHARHSFIKGCATAIRRALADSAFPLPELSAWHHDSRVHAIARTRGDFGYIERPLMKYRMHASQSSGYILPAKRGSGRILAALDHRAMKASTGWARGLRLSLLPHSDHVLRDLLEASEQSALAPIAIPALTRMHDREFLGTDKGISEIVRAARLLRLYLAGGYKDIGGISQFIVDILRSTKSKNHASEQGHSTRRTQDR